MGAWWTGLDTIHQVFYLLAIPSTVILLLQTILLLFGVGNGHDADTDGADADVNTDFDSSADGDVYDGTDGDFVPDHDVPHDQGPAHESGLRILTVRGIVAFLAIGGWTGLAVLDMGGGPALSTVLALVLGVGAMVLVALLLKASLRLQQSGNLDLSNAIGLQGEVYVPIPQDGRGKVTLVLQERYMEMDAVCYDRALKTGEPVQVADVLAGNVLVVTPLQGVTLNKYM